MFSGYGVFHEKLMIVLTPDQLHHEAEIISNVAHNIEDEIVYDIDVIVEGGEHLDELVDEYYHDHPVRYNLIL